MGWLVAAIAVVGVVLIFAGVSALSGTAGSAMKNGADHACLVDSPGAANLGEGHNPESLIAEGSWSLVPLGLECSFIATDTGERVSVRPSPLPTGLIISGAFLASLASISAQRRRRTNASEVPG
jgi:hypothetical protein